MPPRTYRVRLEGLADAQRMLTDMGGRALHPETALRAPATLRDLQESERRRFRRGFSPAASPDWVREKRRRGLDPRTLRASGLLESALANATHGVRVRVWNGTLTWGIQGGRNDLYYAQVLARRRRTWRAVVIDRDAVARIGNRVGRYVTTGSVL